MDSCINLRKRFGKQYKIRFDEAYDHKGVHRKNLDPWYMQMPCQRGIIYPIGGDNLAAEVDYHPHVAKKLSSLPGVTLSQSGEHEKTFTFPVEMFDKVSVLLRPKKRRQMTDAQRAECAARLAKVRQQNPTPELNPDL